MKTLGNGRENPLTIPAIIFFVGNGNGNGNAGREYETDITGYRERNNSIGNKPVTIGNRKLKTETPPHVTISNI